MRCDFNQNEFGLPIEGWAQVHDGEITDSDLNFGPDSRVPSWLQQAMRDAFTAALPDLVEARQRGAAAERDDEEYHYRADEPARDTEADRRAHALGATDDLHGN